MSERSIPAALRREVVQRAEDCCEYCRFPANAVFAAHEIDHIVSLKHGGSTAADNLALSCALCNKHKGSDIASIDPETGEISALFHPRRDIWQEHFEIKRDGRITPRTPAGRVTVRLLQLNRLDRVEERRLLLEVGELHLSL